MEYVHGKDLRAILKSSRTKNKPMPVDLAVLVISKIASGLDYAHRKRGPNGQPLNLVHRDVSPQNILISYEGEVKLVDFGIAKAATKAHVTQHGALKGKLLYMSPEQAWGRNVDKRSDIFSLGVVLYELLTGRPLFFDENDTEVSILEKVREARITPTREFNSRVPQELEKIVGRALKKNADDRYQSAYEMQKDLDNLFYSESYTATGATLANYVREMFPEESHEGEMKEPVAGKEPVKYVAASVATDVPPAVAKPQPQQPVAQPKPEPVAAKAPEPITSAPEKKAPVAASPVEAPTKQQQSAFRDISAPDIMASSPTRRFPILPVGIIVAIAVAAFAYFMFRSPEQEPTKPVEQAQQAPKAHTLPPSSTSEPAPSPAATTQVETKQPVDEKKAAAAEEEKRLAEQKAEAEKKKKEEEAARRKEEERLKEEQRLAELKKQEEAAEQQQQQQQELQQEDAKVAEVQPTPAPVQETPPPALQEPVVKKEEPKPAEAKPSVNEGDLVEMVTGVTKPEVITRTKPNYPPAALKQKVEGTVVLSLLVTEGGKVGDVKVLRPAGGATGLNEAAIAAVKKWTFRPALKAGKKVKIWVTYPIVFKLQG
jgi:TonB family protein